MRRIASLVWNFWLALVDRARFYVGCVRESDLLDGCIILAGCAVAIVGALLLAALSVKFCQWMEGR